ncbi:hypothetical protein Gasu2_05250 [Galdieria sulphuraria]|nr:hypothetical protein Gasu2_05250 [Galdieria sulphuraria]
MFASVFTLNRLNVLYFRLVLFEETFYLSYAKGKCNEMTKILYKKHAKFRVKLRKGLQETNVAIIFWIPNKQDCTESFRWQLRQCRLGKFLALTIATLFSLRSLPSQENTYSIRDWRRYVSN